LAILRFIVGVDEAQRWTCKKEMPGLFYSLIYSSRKK